MVGLTPSSSSSSSFSSSLSSSVFADSCWREEKEQRWRPEKRRQFWEGTCGMHRRLFVPKTKLERLQSFNIATNELIFIENWNVKYDMGQKRLKINMGLRNNIYFLLRANATLFWAKICIKFIKRSTKNFGNFVIWTKPQEIINKQFFLWYYGISIGIFNA